MNSALAPWENPDLPAPFARIERTIEGRTRRFALWQWDERLAWRDLRNPKIWWATFDSAATLNDWERAVEAGKFGRTYSERCHRSCAGDRIGLSTACTFTLQRDFYVIVDARHSGWGREKASPAKDSVWREFNSPDNVYARRKRARGPSIWRFDRHFQGIDLALIRAFGPVMLQRLPVGLTDLIQSAEKARPMLIMRDLLKWNFINQTLLGEFANSHDKAYQKIIAHFGLPLESVFHVWGGVRQPSQMTLVYSALLEYQRWEVRLRVSPVFTAHEQLELQLRLRQSLAPILSPTEIEAILNAPKRP